MRNILFIMSDQFRHDTMGFKGKFPVRTPNLDVLAANGTVFENAYCANPVCVPARASLMTGVYSYDHGVYYNDANWPRSMETLPRSLTDNCYYAVHIGKKHIFPNRCSIGFDKLVLKQGYGDFRKKREKALTPNQGSWTTVETLNRGYPIEPTDQPIEHFEPVHCTDKALHELDLIASRRECGPDGDEPFFMKISYSKPHSPCNPPEPYFSMYDRKDLPPPVATEAEIKSFSQQARKWYDIWNQMDDERKLKHRAQYMGCVTLVDEQIGRVVQKLKDMGVYDNTLIIFTSDHGDHLCDHHMQQKAFFYDCSAKVPFIWSGPSVPKGKRVKENVSHIDMFPTLMEYCELAMPRIRDAAGELIYRDTHDGDAQSLIPYFYQDGPVNPERIVISENAMYGQRFMLKKGDEKVNHYVEPDAPGEFDYFNLAEDPDELDNKGGSFTADDLSPDMRAAFNKVLSKSKQYQSGHYLFQGRVRDMFT